MDARFVETDEDFIEKLKHGSKQYLRQGEDNENGKKTTTIHLISKK